MQAAPASTDHRRLALALGALVCAAHLVIAGRYDLFRDELYFIVCGQHPAFGYVDQPPLVPLLAAALHQIGLGAWALRLPVVLAAGALVWLAVRFVRLLEGGRVAALLAAMGCALAPMMIGMSATLNTSAFDPLLWTALAYLLVKAIRADNGRALVVAGLVVGLALEIKYAMLFWVAGLVAGLLATPQRRLLARAPLWQGAALAALIAAPSFVWQALHGFPFLELGAAAQDKNAAVALGPFLANQLFVMNPLFAPLWLAGLAAPFVARSLRDLRFVPVACLVVLAIVRLGHGKDYYLAPLYPTLFALGAVALAPLLRTRPAQAAAGLLAVAGVAASAVAAPLAAPILTPARLVDYIAATGLAPQPQERSFAGTELPQLFADQLGWHDFTRQVEAAWARIPAAERSRTAIKVDNYGEAAALDLYGRGLPPVLSGHNQYYLWGLRGQEPTQLLLVEDDPASLAPYCDRVVQLGTTYSRFAMRYENGKAIVWCAGLRQPLRALWPRAKHFE